MILPNKYSIGRVGVSDVNFKRLILLNETAILNRTKIRIAYLNHFIFNLTYKDNYLTKLINNIEIIHPDGIGIWLACRFIGEQRIKRFNWTDHALNYLRECEIRGWSIFFLGSTADYLELVKCNLLKLYPNLNLSGMHNGYNNLSEVDLISIINNSNADILWVGLGSPKQEVWISNHCKKLNVPVIQAVGDIFSFLAGKRRRGPVILQRLGLEWIFRVFSEPRRLWKRYLIGIPLFIFRIAKLKISNVK